MSLLNRESYSTSRVTAKVGGTGQTQTSSNETSISLPTMAQSWSTVSKDTLLKFAVNDRTGQQGGGFRTLSSLDLRQFSESSGGKDMTYNGPQSMTISHSRYDNTYLLVKHGSIGPGGSGTGMQMSTMWTASWGEITTNGETEPWGDSAGQSMPMQKLNLSWGANQQMTTTWDVLASDFWNNPGVAWVTANLGSLLQIAFGVVDVLSGLAMTLGTCGGAVIPGVALMAIGIDQILTGASNIANPGVQSMSVFQFAGYSVAKSAGLSEGTSQVIGELTPMLASLGAGILRKFVGCFAAGTPIRTPEGAIPIEEIKPGDVVLSRSEFDPNGPVETRVVEEVFVRTAPVLELRVGGRTIATSGEHPFFAQDRGWTPANELERGDRVIGQNSEWYLVEEVQDSGRFATVYNFRVADWHTYFVGSEDWGFSVWAHNVCHGNSLSSTKLTTLYQLVDQTTGVLLKWGISSNPLRRYTSIFLASSNAKMVEVLNGSRRSMANIERSATSQLPGPLNLSDGLAR